MFFIGFFGWVFFRNTYQLKYIEVSSDKISLPILKAKQETRNYALDNISNLLLITNGVPVITFETNEGEKVLISLVNMEENDFYSLFFLLKEKVPAKTEELPQLATSLSKASYIVLVLIFFISPLIVIYLTSLKSIQNSYHLFKVFVFIAIPILGGIVHQRILKNLSSDLKGHLSDLINPDVTKNRNSYGQYLVVVFYIFLVGSIFIMRQVKGIEIPNNSALIGFICALSFTLLFQFVFRNKLKSFYGYEFLICTITLLLFGFMFFTQLYTFLLLKFPQWTL